MTCDVILVAAGRGTRARREPDDLPKTYRHLAGKPVVQLALEALQSCAWVRQIVPVIHPDDAPLWALLPHGAKVKAAVFGGETRMESVAAGLRALETSDADVIAVHDAARPFLSLSLLQAGYETALQAGAAIPTLPLHEACARVTPDHQQIEQAVDRQNLVNVQTPQFFRTPILQDAFIRATHTSYVDESSLLIALGIPVATFMGDRANIKLTTPQDFLWAEQWLEQTMMTITTYGYDVHRTESGDHVWLAGVKIPAPFSLQGHSDADVILHALTDALLGVLGDGDIGVYFPPTDAKWRGAASHQFVRFALEKLALAGAKLVHVDVTLIAEAPKIGPHRQAMQARLAELCGLHPSRIGLKATTAETLGALGRREGVAAHVVVTTRVPFA